MRKQKSASLTVISIVLWGLLGIGAMGAVACSDDPDSIGENDNDERDSDTGDFVDGEVHDLVMGEEYACVMDEEGVVDCGYSHIFQNDQELFDDSGWARIEPGPWLEEGLGIWATSDGENWVGFGKERLIDENFDLIPERQWKQIASARSHSCGIDIEGRIECWGQDTSIELGTVSDAPDGDGWLRLMRHADTPSHPPFCAVHTDGHLQCWGGDATMEELVDNTPTGEEWVDAVMHDNTICALEEDGNIECWQGLSEPRDWFDTYADASVKDGTELRDMIFVDAVLIAVDGQGEIHTWGPEEEPASGEEHELMTQAIDESGFHQVEGATVSYGPGAAAGFACALDGQGAMECWGNDSFYDDYFP